MLPVRVRISYPLEPGSTSMRPKRAKAPASRTSLAYSCVVVCAQAHQFAGVAGADEEVVGIGFNGQAEALLGIEMADVGIGTVMRDAEDVAAIASQRDQGLVSVCTRSLRVLLPPYLAIASQHAPNPRPSVAIIARNIRAAKIGPAIGREKCRQRPSALAADGRHRGLVARIHVGPLVAIHFHGNEKTVNERGDFWVFVRFTDP